MSTLIPWDPLDVCLESPSKHVYQTVHFISQTFLNQFDLVLNENVEGQFKNLPFLLHNFQQFSK